MVLGYAGGFQTRIQINNYFLRGPGGLQVRVRTWAIGANVGAHALPPPRTHRAKNSEDPPPPPRSHPSFDRRRLLDGRFSQLGSAPHCIGQFMAIRQETRCQDTRRRRAASRILRRQLQFPIPPIIDWARRGCIPGRRIWSIGGGMSGNPFGGSRRQWAQGYAGCRILESTTPETPRIPRK